MDNRPNSKYTLENRMFYRRRINCETWLMLRLSKYVDVRSIFDYGMASSIYLLIYLLNIFLLTYLHIILEC